MALGVMSLIWARDRGFVFCVWQSAALLQQRLLGVPPVALHYGGDGI